MRDHLTVAGRSTDPRLAAVLAAAAAPAERPVPGEAAALAQFRAVMASPADHQRSSMKTRTTKLVAAGALSALTFVGGGVAVAATELPEQAADAATAALAAVGLKAADSATTHTKSVTATEQEAVESEVTEQGPPADLTANDHGEAVSELATTTEAEGADKGEAISTLARTKGEQQRAAAETEVESETETETDEESSTSGRATAAEKSGGASDAGAANADRP